MVRGDVMVHVTHGVQSLTVVRANANCTSMTFDTRERTRLLTCVDSGMWTRPFMNVQLVRVSFQLITQNTLDDHLSADAPTQEQLVCDALRAQCGTDDNWRQVRQKIATG